MATASRISRRMSEIQDQARPESVCIRCGGLMVSDFYMDLFNRFGELKCAAKRCVQCGEVLDPVIQRNREACREPMTHYAARAVNDLHTEALQERRTSSWE